MADDLRPLVDPVLLAFDGVRVVERDARMDDPMAATEARLQIASDLDPIVAAVRAMYRGLGIDPTRTRPSSEALLRRIRRGQAAAEGDRGQTSSAQQGEPLPDARGAAPAVAEGNRGQTSSLPRINALVDICNWCSVETQLPFGLYDRARIAGSTIVLRRGRPGEGYEGIRKERVNVGGRLALADAEGPFGNPTSDSARTMVSTATTSALFVIYAPRGVPGEARARAVALLMSRVPAFCGGRLSEGP